MLSKIITQLKTGAITNVIAYGSMPIPEPPYVVVKEEDHATGFQAYRVVVHMTPGNQDLLDDYVRETLSNLLKNFSASSIHGAVNQLDEGSEGGKQLIIGNDDGTIAKERVFLMPSINF